MRPVARLKILLTERVMDPTDHALTAMSSSAARREEVQR